MTSSDKSSQVIYGLAFADSLAGPSAYFRVASLAPKRTARLQGLEKFRTEHLQTNLPTPYTHAQAPHLLNPEPSVMSEWFTFSMQGFLSQKPVLEHWQTVIDGESEIRTRGGTKIALKNLAIGMKPPFSGHDNPHYFDDLAMIRGLGAALIKGTDKARVLDSVQSDSQLTHSEDGVWCAVATAALLFDILSGVNTKQAIDSALHLLPIDSWARQRAQIALGLTQNCASLSDRVLTLENYFVDRIYAYGVSAPDTFGLLIAHLRSAESANELFASAYMHRRNQEALPALIGAFTSAAFGGKWLPSGYVDSDVKLAGISIPALRGISLIDLTQQVVGS